MINNDQPKNRIKEDEIGYAYFSYNLAKIIKEVEIKDNAYVIGICGKWGDGKTTIINYIKEILFYSYQMNIDLSISNCRNIIEDIKNSNNLQTESKHDYVLNKVAIFNTCISCIILLITLFIKFNFCKYIQQLQFIDKCLLFESVLFVITIPKARNYILNIVKELFDEFLSWFKFTNYHKCLDIEFIDFNPWNYQKNEKDIIENFFMVLANKINIKNKPKYKNINLLLQYVNCLLNLKLPKTECQENISEIKADICRQLKQRNKKYVIIIDDLDRIQPQDALTVFKVVKLLADFPNIIYFLAYDKDYLTNQWTLQNSNYIQKIIQLEKNIPIIPKAKLKEIFIKRVTNILENSLNESDKNELSKIYDTSISNLIKNIRDINRFENSFSLNYISNKNVKEINVFDYLLISILEEFDKKTYTLIQDNKNLLFELIGAFDLKKHIDFVQNISKNVGFQIFMFLFTPYLSKLEEVINHLANNKTTSYSQYKSDVPQHEITRNLDLFRYYYKKFIKDDNYRRICDKESFDNYFFTSVVTSLVTDTEYKKIIASIKTPQNFANVFTNIFSKNEDKFKDFCRRISRDNNIISDVEKVKNIVKGCLAIEDELLYRLFSIKEFCESILSIIKIKRLFTKPDMLNILLNSFAKNNVVQEIFWYYELSMSNTDDYFKTDKYTKFNMINLKNKISTNSIFDNNNLDYILTILIKLRMCNIKPSNFKDLTNKILQSEKHTIELLKSCINSNDYKFYFEFSKIQDVLIKYYLLENNNYLVDHRFLNEVVREILNKNLKDKIQLFKNKMLSQKYDNINLYIQQIKNIEQINDEQQKNNLISSFLTEFDLFKRQNVFSALNSVSDNELIIKYTLDVYIKEKSSRNKLDTDIKCCITIIEEFQSIRKSIENIETAINELNKLKEKYTKIINELEQAND